MRKDAFYFSAIYSALYGVLFVLTAGLGWAIKSIFISNVAALGLFLLPLFPLLWLTTVRWDKIRKAALWIYGGILVLLSPIALIAFVWILNDLQIGNGYRPVFEHDLEGESRLVIYRTPDEGAFGGDNIQIARVRPTVLPGFERREFFTDGIVWGRRASDSNHVQIDGKQVPVPSYEELRKRGKLCIR